MLSLFSLYHLCYVHAGHKYYFFELSQTSLLQGVDIDQFGLLCNPTVQPYTLWCLVNGKSILKALKVTLIEDLLNIKCKFMFHVSEGRKLFVCELLVIFPQIIFTKCWIIKIIISNLIISGDQKQMLHLSNVRLFYHKLIEFAEQNQATNQQLVMLQLVAKTI